VKLEVAYQKKLVEDAKRKSELTWKELAQCLHLSKAYLKSDLRYERVLLPESVYKRLCRLTDVDCSKHIIAVLDPNWGKVKGGRIGGSLSKPKPARLLVDHSSSELAEAIGIMLGDGNSWMRPGFYYVRISGHSENDREYLLNHVRVLFSRIFKIQFNVSIHKTSKELTLTKGSKDLVYTLEHWGFPPGNKKRNNVGVPSWVFESKEYLEACVRGLVDTDGSVCPITGRKYPYIWFNSSIPNLRNTFALAMGTLGFRLAKWSCKGTPQTYIAKKSAIERYSKEIGFNNPKHKRHWGPGGVDRSNLAQL